MKPGVASRAAARLIIKRVLRQGAYSNIVVRPETAGLLPPDARFARKLAYETIRNLLRVDRTIAFASNRPPAHIQNDVVDALRVGVTELLFLGTATHAAVDSAVEVTRSVAPSAGGFCNAVMRKVARSGEPALPDGEEGAALRLGQPLWIYRMLVDSWGRHEAEAFLAASQLEAARIGRLRPGGEAGALTPLPGIAGAFELPAESEAAEDWAVQDGSSIAVGLALDPQPAEKILDVAAAPGGKTLHIADQMRGKGVLVAADRHRRRVTSAAARTGVSMVRWCVVDGRRTPFRAGTFDRVLVDAPCSGLGTMRRRPEVRFRVEEARLPALAALQAQLVSEARRVVRRGGLVVYSVCTVTPQETVEVIEGHPAEEIVGLPGRDWGKGRLLAPHLTRTDGMFLARIRN